jgi:hypothetical protein
MALLGKQKDLDKNKDGKISGEDFAMLREQRMSGGLLDDDMMRVGYAEGELADGELVGPEELDYIDFGARDKYVNENIYTGIRSMSRHINKHQKTFKNDPDRLVDYVNQSFQNVQKNTKYQGNINKDTFYNTLEKELSTYNVDLPLQENREQKAVRVGYAEGTSEGVTPSRYMDVFNQLSKKEKKQVYQTIMSERTDDLQDLFGDKKGKIVGGLLNISDRVVSPLLGLKGLNLSDNERERFVELAMPIINEVREQKAEGGEMLPDEEMEQNFVDFVVSEALSPEEKSMLEEQLEANPELSIMFDKVVETASEFTGAGPVEGPGTGTSDDIPARLSDGEFVFTAKAVEQIGADNLMQMMKDAEAAYDAGGEREAMQEGGMPSDTEKVEVEYTINRPADAAVSGVTPLLAEQEQEDMMDEEIKKSMLGLTPYVRS